MKRVVIIILLSFFIGCNVPEHPEDVVISVELAKVQWYTKSYKYIVETNHGFTFYTDELLKVGDTIKITKKR